MTTDDKERQPDPEPSPELALGTLLLGMPGVTIGTAESCTGGNIAARITSVAGSSSYYQGGIVSYANTIKAGILGVPASILANPGAVSAECADAMASGARNVLGVDWAVSTTGIAGPGGGTERKPIGLVYIATAGPDRVHVSEHHFAGGRQEVIQQATGEALLRLLLALQSISGIGIRAANPAR